MKFHDNFIGYWCFSLNFSYFIHPFGLTSHLSQLNSILYLLWKYNRVFLVLKSFVKSEIDLRSLNTHQNLKPYIEQWSRHSFTPHFVCAFYSRPCKARGCFTNTKFSNLLGNDLQNTFETPMLLNIWAYDWKNNNF